MYDEETKTFSFPYDQKRIDALKSLFEYEVTFHDEICEIRNEYNKSRKTYHWKDIHRLDYLDGLLYVATRRMAQISILLLRKSNVITKGDY